MIDCHRAATVDDTRIRNHTVTGTGDRRADGGGEVDTPVPCILADRRKRIDDGPRDGGHKAEAFGG